MQVIDVQCYLSASGDGPSAQSPPPLQPLHRPIISSLSPMTMMAGSVGCGLELEVEWGGPSGAGGQAPAPVEGHLRVFARSAGGFLGGVADSVAGSALAVGAVPLEGPGREAEARPSGSGSGRGGESGGHADAGGGQAAGHGHSSGLGAGPRQGWWGPRPAWTWVPLTLDVPAQPGLVLVDCEGSSSSLLSNWKPVGAFSVAAALTTVVQYEPKEPEWICSS